MGSDHDVFFEKDALAQSGSVPARLAGVAMSTPISSAWPLTSTRPSSSARLYRLCGAETRYLANLSDDDAVPAVYMLKRNALQTERGNGGRAVGSFCSDAAAATRVHFAVERGKVHSIEAVSRILDEGDHARLRDYLDKLQALLSPPQGVDAVCAMTGCMRETRIGAHGAMPWVIPTSKTMRTAATASLRLSRHTTAHGDGRKFEYEALDLVDGDGSVSDIRDWLVADSGPCRWRMSRSTWWLCSRSMS